MSDRTYGLRTWSFLMFGLNTCIPMFFLGSISYGLGLSPTEMILAALLGNFFAVIAMLLNAAPGVKYGIPYPVQAREAFGFLGSYIPTLFRGIVGAGWFGIEVFAGSLALTDIVLYALGVSNPAQTAFTYVTIFVVIYLAAVYLVMGAGLKGIGMVADYGGPLMLLYFVWLVWFISTKTSSFNIPAGVGLGSGAFAVMLGIQTNWWATMAINISDLSRGAKSYTAVIVGAMVGIVVGQIVGTSCGYYLSAFTTYILPQDIILNFAPGAIAIILGLFFAFLAPFSTDVTANTPALVNIFTSIFKLKWKYAVAAACILAFFITPWWNAANATAYLNYVQSFAGNYGLILGPIAGVLICSYWVLRKQNLDMKRLYTRGPGGYWYHGGIRYSGLGAFLLAIVLCYVTAYALPNTAGIAIQQWNLYGSVNIPIPGQLAWYTGVIYGFVLMWILTKLTKEY
ncbi:MAG TPA: cytosine permease [Conexivisphaerales archaeon]|nr:cytosine permease [Conexivisphaerales archaeon]